VAVKGVLTKVDSMMSVVYKDYMKFFKYLGVGIIGSVADWIVFYALIGLADVFYLYAVILSYFVGMIINFFLNKYYTFNNTYKKLHFQFFSFAVVALIGLALNEVLLYALVHYVFGSPSDLFIMVSRIVATFVVFVWNFIANKQTTFKIFQ
jgi:putative flippase GtrA